ncbi:MAG TPA: asparagine synthase (glutamine-hydrolyzing) [Thermoleophilaceae bacterium]|nr:asparagine synthase (glutamine-hydrolyzing) [Thermoleophilaceae bacterium]
MCGICGLASLDAAGPDPDALGAMSAALAHRGPDSDGMFIDDTVGLAARRLSIIDLPTGDQPIADEEGRIHVVHNGEIYNYRRLRDRLRRAGHRFSTSSDTEVIVHLYEELGPAFVNELRGMFAVALWDVPRRRLVLARDPFGIKPLYYHEHRGGLSFASELKALTRDPRVPRDIDPTALESFLAFNMIPAPQTVFREVRKLPAGNLLVWEAGRVRTEEYARPRPAPASEVRREDEGRLTAELLERLRDSVRAHLVADVPVGVLLSGGVDSAAITALAAEEVGAGLKTFTVGFQERSFDEVAKARLVADRYGTEHHEVTLLPDAAELLPELVATFDEPFADSSALPTYLVSRLAASHVKVALSGEGGDELFGGYHTYVADLLATPLRPLAAVARPLVERLPSSSRKVSLDYKAKRFVRAARLPPLERHHAWKEIFSGDARDALLDRGEDPSFDPLDVYRRCYAETEGAEPLSRLQDVDVRVYLADDLLVKLDRTSMAHSLETRVPFLDPAVHGIARALPTHLKVRGLAKKRLLRRAVRPLLPRSIVDGRKQGFSIPAAAWLRGELEPFAREILSPDRIRRQGYLRPAAVTQVLERHVSGREDLSRQLWGLLVLSMWLDGTGAA